MITSSGSSLFQYYLRIDSVCVQFCLHKGLSMQLRKLTPARFQVACTTLYSWDLFTSSVAQHLQVRVEPADMISNAHTFHTFPIHAMTHEQICYGIKLLSNCACNFENKFHNIKKKLFFLCRVFLISHILLRNGW